MNSANSVSNEQDTGRSRATSTPRRLRLEILRAPLVDRRQPRPPARHSARRDLKESDAAASDVPRLEIDARIDPHVGQVGDQPDTSPSSEKM
jgi:hypothetical protein